MHGTVLTSCMQMKVMSSCNIVSRSGGGGGGFLLEGFPRKSTLHGGVLVLRIFSPPEKISGGRSCDTGMKQGEKSLRKVSRNDLTSGHNSGC